MASLGEARERLLKADSRFRRLSQEHGEYEPKLEQLRSQRWVSDEEQLEEVRLKKKKLAIKDEMESILKRDGD